MYVATRCSQELCIMVVGKWVACFAKARQAIQELMLKASVPPANVVQTRPRTSLTNFMLPPWKLSYEATAKVSTGGAPLPRCLHKLCILCGMELHISVLSCPCASGI